MAVKSKATGSLVGLLLRAVLAILAAGAGLGLVIALVGHLTWMLPRVIEAVPAGAMTIDMQPTAGAATHTVAEWPATRGRHFQEAPMLSERVHARELPPVADRLPRDPLVIVPPQQMGPYGGTWTRYANGPGDINVMMIWHRLPNEGLLRWDAMGQRLLPNLATAVPEPEEGGRAYTFHLRKGVRWSDGEPFTADDILFWYEDVLQNAKLTPSSPTSLRRGGKLVEVTRDGDYTVRFRFAEPYGLFLKNMASGLSADMTAYPKHYLRRYHARYTDEAALNAETVARGLSGGWPALFKAMQDWNSLECPRLWAWIVKGPDERPVRFERNPYYWKVDPEGRQLPYIDRLCFEIYEQLDIIQMKIANGEVGMQGRHAGGMDRYPLYMQAQARGHFQVRRWVGANGPGVTFNLNSKDPVLRTLFNDRRFRIGLSHAIDRQMINQVVAYGVAQPRQLCPAPTSPFYWAEAEQANASFDKALANRLLDEAGLARRDREGFRLRPDGQPLFLFIDTLTPNDRVLQLVSECWRDVGVRCDVKEMARQLAYERKGALMHDAIFATCGYDQQPVLDPRQYFPFNGESNQAIGFANWYQSEGAKGQEPTPEIRECMDCYRKLESTPDEAEQERLFRRILELNVENCWVIGIYGGLPDIVIVKNSFLNVPLVANQDWPFRGPSNTAPECYAIDESKL